MLTQLQQCQLDDAQIQIHDAAGAHGGRYYLGTRHHRPVGQAQADDGLAVQHAAVGQQHGKIGQADQSHIERALDVTAPLPGGNGVLGLTRAGQSVNAFLRFADLHHGIGARQDIRNRYAAAEGAGTQPGHVRPVGHGVVVQVGEAAAQVFQPVVQRQGLNGRGHDRKVGAVQSREQRVCGTQAHEVYAQQHGNRRQKLVTTLAAHALVHTDQIVHTNDGDHAPQCAVRGRIWDHSAQVECGQQGLHELGTTGQAGEAVGVDLFAQRAELLVARLATLHQTRHHHIGGAKRLGPFQHFGLHAMFIAPFAHGGELSHELHLRPHDIRAQFGQHEQQPCARYKLRQGQRGVQLPSEWRSTAHGLS